MSKLRWQCIVVIAAMSWIASTAAAQSPADRPAVSFGGELRARAEAYGRVDLGLGGAAANDYLLGRLMLHADIRATDRVRGFIQLRAGEVSGERARLAPTQQNELDVHQAFVDVRFTWREAALSLKVGRQEMVFGSGRLVAAREGPNIRQSFDGVRGSWSGGAGNRVDLFYANPVIVRAGAFDDESSGDYRFWGAHLARSLGPTPGSGVDVYYLGTDRREVSFGQGSGAETRHSLGTRLYGRRHRWDWDLEAVWQFGRFNGAVIRAFTFANEVGYRWPQLPWSPRLGVRFDLASGDGDLSDRRLTTFEAPFPRLPYLAEPNFVAPANIIDLHPSLTLLPRRNLRLTIEQMTIWKHRSADAFYLPPLRPVLATRNGGRFMHRMLQSGVRWQMTPELSVEAIYARAYVGRTLAAAGARNSDFLMVSASARF